MLRLDYQLHDHGWATASVGNGEADVEFEVSYVSDALGDLARATRDVLRGVPVTRCAFEREPGEHRVTLTREGNEVSVTVERFDYINFVPKDWRGELVLAGRCGLLDLAEEVLNCLFRVLDRHGEAGYLERWQHAPFPTAEYRELLQLHGELAAARPAG